ncbi:MAG: NAD(P)H-dependent oxidoreductase [bacterium]|jgi:NAD(P)H-dependent FMN reductase|nr:NAD(P)H-dependent oxidoreductase [bacterium]
MNICVLSCSLHPQSRSYVLARRAEENLKNLGVTVKFFDLREYELDFCGRPGARNLPVVEALKTEIQGASAVLISAPIYNFYANAVAKNIIELTGGAWIYKVVGFMCAAGGQASYMSIMNLANSLMLDFRCMIVPRFVYALGSAFGNDREPDMFVKDTDILSRLEELTEMTVRLARAIDPVISQLPERKGRA